MIPVIDLFAGPGGLSEGFASRTDKTGNPIFRIALSIEMDKPAYQTLRLRSFFRQFKKENVPEKYYEVLRGKLTVEELYRTFKNEAAASAEEAWQATLGKVDPTDV